MNGTLSKNQLIFQFASGTLGPAKSIFTSTYLYLNSNASYLNRTFENMLGDELLNNKNVEISKVKYTDCISNKVKKTHSNNEKFLRISPLEKIVGPLNKIKWKQVYKGFKEFSPNVEDDDEIKLVKKWIPGASVPIHSHGKEYILVLDGSFCDEYGKYNKGDIQINDQKIKHTPIACKNDGCICLSITEKDAIFYR